MAAEQNWDQVETRVQLKDDGIHLYIPRIPGTNKFFEVTVPMTFFCMMRSWERIDDNALHELLDKAQAETNRRRALHHSLDAR